MLLVLARTRSGSVFEKVSTTIDNVLHVLRAIRPCDLFMIYFFENFVLISFFLYFLFEFFLVVLTPADL